MSHRGVPNGVDLTRFHNANPLARSDFGFTDDDILLIYAGRIAPEKNLGFLLQSFAGVSQIIPNAYLLIVGGGQKDHLEAITPLPGELGIKDRVRFVGMVKERAARWSTKSSSPRSARSHAHSASRRGGAGLLAPERSVMTDLSNEGLWINYEAAMASVRQFDDAALEQFVMRAVTAATVRCASGDPPAAPFDMLFFVKTMAALFEQRDVLIRVFSGEDLRWWSNDDS